MIIKSVVYVLSVLLPRIPDASLPRFGPFQPGVGRSSSPTGSRYLDPSTIAITLNDRAAALLKHGQFHRFQIAGEAFYLELTVVQ